jgi:hypothetical protein
VTLTKEIEWIRREQRRKRESDPVHYWERVGENYVLEAHKSEVASRNQRLRDHYSLVRSRQKMAHDFWLQQDKLYQVTHPEQDHGEIVEYLWTRRPRPSPHADVVRAEGTEYYAHD